MMSPKELMDWIFLGINLFCFAKPQEDDKMASKLFKGLKRESKYETEDD